MVKVAKSIYNIPPDGFADSRIACMVGHVRLIEEQRDYCPSGLYLGSALYRGKVSE